MTTINAACGGANQMMHEFCRVECNFGQQTTSNLGALSIERDNEICNQALELYTVTSGDRAFSVVGA